MTHGRWQGTHGKWHVTCGWRQVTKLVQRHNWPLACRIYAVSRWDSREGVSCFGESESRFPLSSQFSQTTKSKQPQTTLRLRAACQVKLRDYFEHMVYHNNRLFPAVKQFSFGWLWGPGVVSPCVPPPAAPYWPSSWRAVPSRRLQGEASSGGGPGRGRAQRPENNKYKKY